MDTKLKADIAESAVVTELLARGYNVLRPVGDRLAYDLIVEDGGGFVKIQVKSAWFNKAKRLYMVDVRRTKTNRRRMVRDRYSSQDFDIAIIYLQDRKVYYIMPVEIFNRYASSLSIVEDQKRQRLPRSYEFRERWDLI